MILDKLLKRKEKTIPEEKEVVPESLPEVGPEELQEFKLRMFGLMLQALYNSTTVLKAVLHGDDYEIHGDPVTSAIIDGDLLINTFKKMGIYARFTMKEFEDGSKGLKWISKAVVNGLREEFYDMEDVRDGKIFMLDEKIASLNRKLEESQERNKKLSNKVAAVEKYYSSASNIVDKMKTSIHEALTNFRAMSQTKDNEELGNLAKGCVQKLAHALSFQIPELQQEYEKNENSVNTDGTSQAGGTGSTPEEAEKAVEDYYNRQLQGSNGTEGTTEHSPEG